MIHTFSSESDGQDSSTILPAAMQGLLDEKVHFNVGSGEQKLKRTPFDPIIEIILVLWISRNLLNSYLLASGKNYPPNVVAAEDVASIIFTEGGLRPF